MSILDDLPKKSKPYDYYSGGRVFGEQVVNELASLASAQQIRIEKLEEFLGKWKAWHLCEGPMPTFDELEAILKEKI